MDYGYVPDSTSKSATTFSEVHFKTEIKDNLYFPVSAERTVGLAQNHKVLYSLKLSFTKCAVEK